MEDRLETCMKNWLHAADMTFEDSAGVGRPSGSCEGVRRGDRLAVKPTAWRAEMDDHAAPVAGDWTRE